MSTPTPTTTPSEPGPGAGEAAASDDHLRLASRLSSDYLLRSLALLQEMGWGDFMTTLVALAIVQTNVGHLDATGESGPPPDPVRRPVSVLALSGALGLTYETTRRHVAKLIETGVCVRVKGGVIMPAALF